MDGDVMSLSDAARAVGLDPCTLSKWHTAGLLRAAGTRRNAYGGPPVVLVRLSEVRALVASRPRAALEARKRIAKG